MVLLCLKFMLLKTLAIVFFDNISLCSQVIVLKNDLVTDMVAQEEVVQIAKKKRISMDAAQVSKVYVVQFQFVAVREDKNRSCRRTVGYSHCRSYVPKAGFHRRKRFSVSVDFSLSFSLQVHQDGCCG
ncbi:hypothetical protein RND81_14G162000 [Saponaria officinalis]|uniref:Secreted protein n=1 Tax=Saponaria officinalis TaxID=3572 RepID=A0AAW1GN42_SAPOF